MPTLRVPADAPDPALIAEEAERRRDWPAAIAAWRRACDADPRDVTAATGLGLAYLRNQQVDEAERVLGETLRQAAKPAITLALLVAHARAAAVRGDFAVTRARWQAVIDKDPSHRVARQRLKRLENLRLPELRDDAPWLKPNAAKPDTTHAQLMMRFESLGASCEFGLMQRHYGAEPLGLLRWAGINMHNLITALETQFEGIGEPRYTRLEVTPIGEFVTTDTRYGLGMHTFMRNAGQDQEKLLEQLRRRMRFLREKLLADLQEGEKIFVYRHLRSPPDKDLLKLPAALRAYNPANRLVLMRMLPHGAPGQALQRLAPGVLCGAVGDGRRPGKGQGWAVDHAFWLSTCDAAIGMLKEEGWGEGAPPPRPPVAM